MIYSLLFYQQNQFDSIDLSDNEIVKLEGFPLLPRMKTILLNNNRITRISKNLESKLEDDVVVGVADED